MVGDGLDCQCDLTGTWAVLVETDIEWDIIRDPIFGIPIIQAGADTLFSWAIRTLDHNGSTISMQAKPCGGTGPDLCSDIFTAAYSQAIDDDVWDGSGNPLVSLPDLTIADASLNASFVGPSEVSIGGLTLTSDFMDWPASYTSSDITWLDPDGDGYDGLRSDVIATGTSASCGYDYEYLPHPNDPALSIVAAGSGVRTQAHLDGDIESCDRLSGFLRGPDTSVDPNGLPLADGHVGSCILLDGGSERDCDADEIATLDANAQNATQRTTASRFTMIRVADGYTCPQTRAADYSPPSP
jgi:hypothetical protein